MEAFLIGFSTGWYCFATCGTYLLPFLFAEEIKTRKNALLIILFLLGRLTVYLIIGAISGGISQIITSSYYPAYSKISPVVNLTIGLILLTGGIFHSCPPCKGSDFIKKIYNPALNAFILGVFAGLSICPPLIAAIAGAFQTHSIYNGIIYFLSFYFGTTIYFLPLFGIKWLPDKKATLQLIARIVMFMMAFYFFDRALVGFFS